MSNIMTTRAQAQAQAHNVPDPATCTELRAGDVQVTSGNTVGSGYKSFHVSSPAGGKSFCVGHDGLIGAGKLFSSYHIDSSLHYLNGRTSLPGPDGEPVPLVCRHMSVGYALELATEINQSHQSNQLAVLVPEPDKIPGFMTKSQSIEYGQQLTGCSEYKAIQAFTEKVEKQGTRTVCAYARAGAGLIAAHEKAQPAEGAGPRTQSVFCTSDGGHTVVMTIADAGPDSFLVACWDPNTPHRVVAANVTRDSLSALKYDELLALGSEFVVNTQCPGTQIQFSPVPSRRMVDGSTGLQLPSLAPESEKGGSIPNDTFTERAGANQVAQIDHELPPDEAVSASQYRAMLKHSDKLYNATVEAIPAPSFKNWVFPPRIFIGNSNVKEAAVILGKGCPEPKLGPIVSVAVALGKEPENAVAGVRTSMEQVARAHKPTKPTVPFADLCDPETGGKYMFDKHKTLRSANGDIMAPREASSARRNATAAAAHCGAVQSTVEAASLAISGYASEMKSVKSSVGNINQCPSTRKEPVLTPDGPVHQGGKDWSGDVQLLSPPDPTDYIPPFSVGDYTGRVKFGTGKGKADTGTRTPGQVVYKKGEPTTQYSSDFPGTLLDVHAKAMLAHAVPGGLSGKVWTQLSEVTPVGTPVAFSMVEGGHFSSLRPEEQARMQNEAKMLADSMLHDKPIADSLNQIFPAKVLASDACLGSRFITPMTPVMGPMSGSPSLIGCKINKNEIPKSMLMTTVAETLATPLEYIEAAGFRFPQLMLDYGSTEGLCSRNVEVRKRSKIDPARPDAQYDKNGYAGVVQDPRTAKAWRNSTLHGALSKGFADLVNDAGDYALELSLGEQNPGLNQTPLNKTMPGMAYHLQSLAPRCQVQATAVELASGRPWQPGDLTATVIWTPSAHVPEGASADEIASQTEAATLGALDGKAEVDSLDVEATTDRLRMAFSWVFPVAHPASRLLGGAFAEAVAARVAEKASAGSEHPYRHGTVTLSNEQLAEVQAHLTHLGTTARTLHEKTTYFTLAAVVNAALKP